jgi:general nucleoside transport system permease protein
MDLVAVLGVEFFAATVRMASPLLYATMGGILNERAGIINIGIEGIMLTGALTGVVVSFYTGDPWIGFAAAAIAGGLIALVHGLLSISLEANQIVSGAAINIACLGLTSFIIRILFGLKEQQRTVPHFVPTHVPILSDIPIIGPIFFAQNVVVYAAYALVPLLAFVLYRSRWGLVIIASGEHPRAADTMGIDPNRVRYVCTVLSGMAGGAGGASLSLGQLHFFVDDMTGGRGFMALAALIFGRWDPVGGLVACLLFGAADALQFRIQATGVNIPYQFMLMLPYVLTLVVLVIFMARARGPAAIGVPYRRETA